MKARGITLDTWAFNALLQACATASDLDSCGSHPERHAYVRHRARRHHIPAPLHRVRQAHRGPSRSPYATKKTGTRSGSGARTTARGGGGAWPGQDPSGAKRHHLGARAAESHAKLTGALTAAEKGGDASPPGIDVGRVMGVGEAARAAAAAAREGLSSVRDVFKDLRKDGEPIRLTPSGDEDRMGSETACWDPKRRVARARPRQSRAPRLPRGHASQRRRVHPAVRHGAGPDDGSVAGIRRDDGVCA
jgi:hypothetical protein